MIQLAWRFLLFQKDSALALWYQARTADSRAVTRKTMIVAVARKLLIALWRETAPGRSILPTRRSRWRSGRTAD
jgi:transposase